MSNSAFTPAVLTVSSGAGSGSGEKNYITNPSMASATTGWNVVGDFTLTRTTAASELPREYTTGTGIKLVATSGTQSTADYMYFDFNLDDVDLNRKLKIQWSQKDVGTYAAGQLAVIITSQADRTTALHTPVTTAIPAVDGDFVTSFDSGSTAALSLVIRATTDMTTGDGIVLSDVIVGPGEIVQGAVVSEWQSYTPTGSWTNTTYTGLYRRVGSDIEIRVGLTLTGTPTGTLNFTTAQLLNGLGLTYNPSGNATNANKMPFGHWHGVDTGTADYIGEFSPSDATSSTPTWFLVYANGSLLPVASVQAGTPFSWGSGDEIGITARFPIAEWSGSGSGTVNLGPGAQVEYAYPTGTWDSSTTSYAYGPSGAQMAALTASRTKDVTWQYAIQTDDVITLEGSTDRTTWFPLVGGRLGSGLVGVVTSLDAAGNLGSGALWHHTSSTTTRVTFAAKAGMANDDAPTTDWPSDAYFRIRKAKASSPVGFGKADSTSFGLVGPRRGQQALTFSSTPAGWLLVRAVGIYYQDQDGNHRLKFNICASATNATLIEATLSGVTFKNVSSYFQAIACLPAAASNQGMGYVTANTGTVSVSTASSQGQFRVSGDVELESKPSWA